MWHTPRANECNEKSESFVKRNADRGAHCFSGLSQQVKMWPTPTAHLHKETNAPSEAHRNEPTISSIVGGSLNPQFCEWLMGYPKDWTEVQDFANGRKKTIPLQESLPASSTEPTV
jgi:hypothetical protein